MAITYLKKSPKTSSTDDNKTTGIVQDLLKNIETTKEQGCIDLTKKFDKYDGDIIVSKDKIEEIKKTLDQKTKDDIQFSFERVRKFAEAQLKNYGQDFEVELSDGLYAGQKLVPVNTAGCYIPGGRYAHIASAVMSVTTAKVAGVKNIIACSPPKEGVGAHPTIVYTADLCGADVILNLGGVPAIAAMTNGLFKNPPADIIVGPGNQFVAEAKRILYGKVGIDLFAGPTETMIIADDTVDGEMCATDLLGQAEHGYNSPACLITNSEKLAQDTLIEIQRILKILPTAETAKVSWNDYGDIIICDDHFEMLSVANEMAYEHVQVMTNRDEWYLENMHSYGALFLGPRTNVANGDKVIGTNHTLPTKKAGRYTGGLWVGKFLKTHSYQKIQSDEAAVKIGEYGSRLCMLEGFVGHAEQCNLRIRRYGGKNIPFGTAAE